MHYIRPIPEKAAKYSAFLHCAAGGMTANPADCKIAHRTLYYRQTGSRHGGSDQTSDTDDKR